jgi:hypothetical protein
MSWEIWQDQANWYPDADDKHTTYRIGFLCNTMDVSFGPVLYFDVSMGFEDAKEEIYKLWEATDPRSLKDYQISDEITRISELEVKE